MWHRPTTVHLCCELSAAFLPDLPTNASGHIGRANGSLLTKEDRVFLLQIDPVLGLTEFH